MKINLKMCKSKRMISLLSAGLIALNVISPLSVVANDLTEDLASGQANVLYVDDASSLQEAIATAEDGYTIQLTSDINADLTGVATNESLFAINKKVSIDGDNHTITVTNGGNNNTSLIGINGEASKGTIIENLIIDGGNLLKRHGINVYESGAIFNNVTVTNCGAFAMVVNGSDVTISNFNASNSGWQSSINIDPGSGVNSPSVLTVLGGVSLEDAYPIKSDGTNVTEVATVTVNSEDFYKVHIEDDKKDKLYYWTREPAISDETTKVGYLDLKVAVEQALSGETITLMKDISISSKIAIDKAITIVGKTGGEKITISAGAGAYPFNLQANSALTVKDLDFHFDINGVYLFGTEENIEKLEITGCNFTVGESKTGNYIFGSGNGDAEFKNLSMSGNVITGVYGRIGLVYMAEGGVFTLTNNEIDVTSDVAFTLCGAENAKYNITHNTVNLDGHFVRGFSDLSATNEVLITDNTFTGNGSIANWTYGAVWKINENNIQTNGATAVHVVGGEDSNLDFGYNYYEDAQGNATFIKAELFSDDGSWVDCTPETNEDITFYPYYNDSNMMQLTQKPGTVVVPTATPTATLAPTPTLAPTTAPTPAPTSTPKVEVDVTDTVVTVTPAPTVMPTPVQTPESTQTPAVETEGVVTEVESIVTDGVAKVEIEKEHIEEVVANALENTEASTVVVEVKKIKNASEVVVDLPASALIDLAKAEQSELVISTKMGEISLNTGALIAALGDASDKSEVSIQLNKVQATELPAEIQQTVGEQPVFDLSVIVDDDYVEHFGEGKAEVTLYYELTEGEKAEGVTVFYVSDNGKQTEMETNYNEVTGEVTFETEHFSFYTIKYVEPIVEQATPSVDENIEEDITAEADDTEVQESNASVLVCLVLGVVIFGLGIAFVIVRKNKKD